MKKHFLAPKGLSMSQAQAISNLCNQRATEIDNILTGINNAERSVVIDGKSYVMDKANPIPSNIVELIQKKAELHACQAFLMENIKAKATLITEEKNKVAYFEEPFPEEPKREKVVIIPDVDEAWGAAQLSQKEVADYIKHEALAAHIGQFIHKNSPLDKLRKDLATLPSIEWKEIENGKQTPVHIHAHHTPDLLLAYHEELAARHREAEQKVNYYKAKIKNLVSAENARIGNINSDEIARVSTINDKIDTEYKPLVRAWTDRRQAHAAKFNADKQLKIKELSALRIEVADEFKAVVDDFLPSTKSADAEKEQE